MLSTFQGQVTYYGTLDDVVERYPWPNALDLKALRQQLVTSAIYGKQILINDGYLVQNPLLLPDLANINKSLIGALLTCGAARLFARDHNADLSSGLLRSAERVTTHRRVTSDAQRWPRLRRQLDYLSQQIGGRSLVWPRDKNMGQIFHLLMARVAGLSGAERDSIIPRDVGAAFDAVFRLYDDAIDKRSFEAARTTWEEMAWLEVTGRDIDPSTLGTAGITKERLVRIPGYERARLLMNIANEVYHLAYSIGAAHAMGGGPASVEAPGQVGVATALVGAFPDILASEQTAQARVGEAKARAMNQLMISLPPDLEFGDDFAFVRDISADTDIRECRDAYLSALERFAGDGITLAEAMACRLEYGRVLGRLMGPVLRQRRGYADAKNLSDLLLNVASDMAKLDPFTAWLMSMGSDHLRSRLIERMLAARVEVALGREGILAAQSRDAVLLVRRHGFYLGPLRQEGIARLTAQVGPHPSLAAR